MKKYIVATSEENRGSLLDALELVGFDIANPARSKGGLSIISINTFGDAIVYASTEIGYYNTYDVEILDPSYVLAHAAELDGAKKPWEVPPEGMRLVTAEERSEFKKPKYYMCILKELSDKWEEQRHFAGGEFMSHAGYAVPTDYVFSNPVKKMTVAEVCGELGYDIEIVKENT